MLKLFLHARHVSAGEILRRLVEVNGEELMSLRSVTKWCSDFSSGEAGIMRELADSQQQAHPTTKHVLNQLSWITEE